MCGVCLLHVFVFVAVDLGVSIICVYVHVCERVCLSKSGRDFASEGPGRGMRRVRTIFVLSVSTSPVGSDIQHACCSVQTDLHKKRAVTEQEGKRWADDHGFAYVLAAAVFLLASFFYSLCLVCLRPHPASAVAV